MHITIILITLTLTLISTLYQHRYTGIQKAELEKFEEFQGHKAFGKFKEKMGSLGDEAQIDLCKSMSIYMSMSMLISIYVVCLCPCLYICLGLRLSLKDLYFYIYIYIFSRM